MIPKVISDLDPESIVLSGTVLMLMHFLYLNSRAAVVRLLDKHPHRNGIYCLLSFCDAESISLFRLDCQTTRTIHHPRTLCTPRRENRMIAHSKFHLSFRFYVLQRSRSACVRLRNRADDCRSISSRPQQQLHVIAQSDTPIRSPLDEVVAVLRSGELVIK